MSVKPEVGDDKGSGLKPPKGLLRPARDDGGVAGKIAAG
jgi:hypothetical protein